MDYIHGGFFLYEKRYRDMLFNRRNRTADQECPGMRQSRKQGVDKKPHWGRKRKKVDAVQAELMEHYQDYMEEFADELSAFGVVQEMEKDREMLEDEQ